MQTTVRATDRTGVEMEALTAAAVAALSLYDTAKAFDRAARIDGLRLIAKSGGGSIPAPGDPGTIAPPEVSRERFLNHTDVIEHPNMWCYGP